MSTNLPDCPWYSPDPCPCTRYRYPWECDCEPETPSPVSTESSRRGRLDRFAGLAPHVLAGGSAHPTEAG